MVLEVASRGRIRYRGVLNSSDALSYSSVHFVNSVMGGLVAKTRNINSHGKPVFRFKEISAIYDSEGACSIIEIPLLRDGKTAEYNCEVEEVEGDDNVNNMSTGYARHSDHDWNCDDFGFDEMTLMEMKASCKKKRKVAKSVDSMQQGKNSLQLKNLSKGSLSHIQAKEEEPDLEEPLSCLKMRLSKNAKVKRKHIAKRACSFPPESSGTGDLQSKSKSRLAPSSIVMQSEPAIHGHSSTQDTPSLCQLNRIKKENVGIEICEQNEACVFDSTAKFCIGNQSPCNELSSESLDSPCQLNQIKSENLDIFIYDQSESCVFDSTAKFCIRNQSPCNELSSESLDSLCQLNQIKSENADIEIYAQNEAYVFDSTAKFCIRNQSPCNESSSESLDKVDGQRMETGESMSCISEMDEFKVSSAEFCGMADGGELKTGDLTDGGELRTGDLTDGGELKTGDLTDGGELRTGDLTDGGELRTGDLTDGGELRTGDLTDGGELKTGDLTLVENSLRGTDNESLAQVLECDDSGLELETGEDTDVVEASTELENHELSPSVIPELKMEIALDHPLSAGSPEAVTVPSSLNSALCPNNEIKPSLQDVLFETNDSSITQMPGISSDDNLLCTETDDGWFCNSGNNDPGNIVNGILVEEEMPMEYIDQDTAPNTSNYSTVDMSAPDAPSQNYLPVADSSQPLYDGSSITKVLLVPATTEELVPPIEDVSRDCSMDACAFDTSEVLTEEQEVENHHPPENLLSTRKVISPKSQEKLRQAVEADELCNRVQLSKHGKRLCFEKWTKNTNSSARDAAEEAEYRPLSHGPLKKLKYATNGSPPKGILKSSHVSCMISCTCKDCSLIHERTEKAIAFSQRQMHDIECLAMKLLNGLKSMKYMVEDALVSRECLSTTSQYTVDEMRIAADDTIKLEETTRKWLSMMARDCNRFCKIMMSKDKATPTKQQPNGSQKERRKVVFADDIGGTLCHVKVLEDHSAPHAV